jgi:hypothetical protein
MGGGDVGWDMPAWTGEVWCKRARLVVYTGVGLGLGWNWKNWKENRLRMGAHCVDQGLFFDTSECGETVFNL